MSGGKLKGNYMTQTELNKVVSLHKMWLASSNTGKRADLRYANLSNADLRHTDLRYANLRYANLTYANLTDANLTGTDLRDTNLRNCTGNNKEVKSLQIGKYMISYTSTILNIGCRSHSLEQWISFSDSEIAELDRGALEWWNLNKEIIITLAQRETRN